MTVKEASDQYKIFANQIFARRKFLHQVRFKYPRKPLKRAIRDVVRDQSDTDNADELFRQHDCSKDERICLT